MLSYDPQNNILVISCNFNNSNIKEIDPENIFRIESKWKNRSLLYSTVQAYAAATHWKPTLSHSIYIQCSCYHRPIRNRSERETKFTSGPLCKDCKRKI